MTPHDTSRTHTVAHHVLNLWYLLILYLPANLEHSQKHVPISSPYHFHSLPAPSCDASPLAKIKTKQTTYVTPAALNICTDFVLRNNAPIYATWAMALGEIDALGSGPKEM
jgi:hypothetical protein